MFLRGKRRWAAEVVVTVMTTGSVCVPACNQRASERASTSTSKRARQPARQPERDRQAGAVADCLPANPQSLPASAGLRAGQSAHPPWRGRGQSTTEAIQTIGDKICTTQRTLSLTPTSALGRDRFATGSEAGSDRVASLVESASIPATRRSPPCAACMTV